jgi:hypothetical protein
VYEVLNIVVGVVIVVIAQRIVDPRSRGAVILLGIMLHHIPGNGTTLSPGPSIGTRPIS